MDLSRDRSRLDAYFLRKAPTAPPNLASPTADTNLGSADVPVLHGSASAPAGGPECMHAGKEEARDAGSDAGGDEAWPEEEAGNASEEECEDDDDEVLAAREALWQQAVMAEEDQGLTGCCDQPEGGCGSEGLQWADRNMGCPEGQWAGAAGVKREEEAAEQKELGVGCSVKQEDRKDEWGRMRKKEQSAEEKIEDADTADDKAAPPCGHAHAACKREGPDVVRSRSSSKRHRSELVSLGLDSPPCGSGPGSFAPSRPHSAAAACCAPAQALLQCKPEGSAAAAHASGAVKREEEQQRQGMGWQCASQDSWSSGNAPPVVAVDARAGAQLNGAEAAAHAAAAVHGRPQHSGTSATCHCTIEPQQQHAAEPSTDGAPKQSGEVIDLTGVDVAEQERILRHIESSQKRAQLRRGCVGGKAAKGHKVSIRDFFARKA